MPDVLILGGSGWLGGRVAARWRDAGASVTVLARGQRPAPAGTRLVVADRDAPEAYREVAGRDWDAVVDLSSIPVQADAAVDALAERAGHWTYVSSVSVYADHTRVGADETAAIVEPGGADDYARAKAAAERSARRLGDRCAIVRPGLIVGPGDASDRFGYWPARFAGDGPVLVPAAGGLFAQVIDVDDLAAFVADAGARRWHGTVDAVGPARPLSDVLARAREAAGYRGPVVEATAEQLVAAGAAYWAGPRSLPLWLPADLPGFATRAGRAYAAAGGGIRPLAETMFRVLRDERERGLDRPRRAGLTRDEEREILATVR